MDHASTIIEKGIKAYRIRSLNDAAAFIVRGLEVDPSKSEGWFFLGLTRHSQGRLTQAEQAYTHVISLNRTRMLAAHTRRGYLRFDRGSLRAAAADFSTALLMSPDDWRLHNMLGLVRIEQEHPCEAAQAFKQALALMPADVNPAIVRDNLARALRLMNPIPIPSPTALRTH